MTKYGDADFKTQEYNISETDGVFKVADLEQWATNLINRLAPKTAITSYFGSNDVALFWVGYIMALNDTLTFCNGSDHSSVEKFLDQDIVKYALAILSEKSQFTVHDALDIS